MKQSTDPYIELRLDLKDPIEIADLSALFAGFGESFDKYVERERPELKGQARMFVREIREGSIIAEVFAGIPDLVGILDSILIVTGFGALFNRRIRNWVSGKFVLEAEKGDLKAATNTLRALAKDKSGEMQLAKFEYREGLLHKEVLAEFRTAEARKALKTIELQRSELEKTDIVDYERVLMTFKRADKDPVKPGSGTGDRVLIEEIDNSDKPVFYASDQASSRVKTEINSSEYPFRLGFVVDVNVSERNGRIVAYSVKEVHEVILLDE